MRQLPLLLLIVVLALGLGWYFGSRPAAIPALDPTQAAPMGAVPHTTLDQIANAPRPTPSDPHALFDTEAQPARALAGPVLGFEDRNRGLPTSGTWIGYPLLHDFNGDGRADLVASNREEDGYSAWESGADGAWILRNDGPEGPDGASVGLPRDMQYGPAAAADMNGDHIDDLVISAHSDALRVYLNDGHMRWTRSPGKVENAFLFLDVDTGNLNSDAYPDVAAIAHFDGGAVLYVGDAEGGLRRLPESANLFPKRTMGKDVKLSDFDADGIDDLVFASDKGLKVFLVHPGEPMTFEDISANLPNPPIGNSIYTVAVGKFVPGDRPQIAAAIIADPRARGEARDYLGIWAYDAENKSWHHVDAGLDRDQPYRDLAAADFDNDGDLDLLTISITSGAVIHLNDGQGHFTTKGRLEGAYNKGRSAVADVDGDGWPDIVIAIPATKDDPAPGRVRCYRNRPQIWK